MKQISYLWSPLILSLMAMSLYFIGFCLYAFITEGSSVYSVTGVIFVGMLIYPIYCLAYANGAIETIRDSFVYQCSPGNYDVIGGRDVWIRYLTQSPAYWTLFGYALTWNVLYSVIVSIIGSIMFAVLTIASSL